MYGLGLAPGTYGQVLWGPVRASTGTQRPGIRRGTYGQLLLGPVLGFIGAYEGKSPGHLRRPTVRPRTGRYTADVIVQSPYEAPVAAERPC